MDTEEETRTVGDRRVARSVFWSLKRPTTATYLSRRGRRRRRKNWGQEEKQAKEEEGEKGTRGGLGYRRRRKNKMRREEKKKMEQEKQYQTDGDEEAEDFLGLVFCEISDHSYWAIQAGLLTPLTFARHCLSPLAAFAFQCVLSSQWKVVTVNLRILHCQLSRHIWRPIVRMCLAMSNNLLLMLQDAPKHIFFYELAIFWSAKKKKRRYKNTFFPPSIPFPQ